MKNEKGDKTIMKKVLLTSVLALSAIASVSYAATKVPSIPGVTAPTSGTVTKANAANNHNNRFGFAVSPLNKKAFSFAGAKTYPAKPVAGTDGKPLDDSIVSLDTTLVLVQD